MLAHSCVVQKCVTLHHPYHVKAGLSRGGVVSHITHLLQFTPQIGTKYGGNLCQLVGGVDSSVWHTVKYAPNLLRGLQLFINLMHLTPAHFALRPVKC